MERPIPHTQLDIWGLFHLYCFEPGQAMPSSTTASWTEPSKVGRMLGGVNYCLSWIRSTSTLDSRCTCLRTHLHSPRFPNNYFSCKSFRLELKIILFKSSLLWIYYRSLLLLRLLHQILNLLTSKLLNVTSGPLYFCSTCLLGTPITHD